MPSISLGREPVAIITIVVVALNAVQTAALNMSTTVHTIIGVALVVLGAILARSAVTPVAAPAQPVPPPAA